MIRNPLHALMSAAIAATLAAVGCNTTSDVRTGSTEGQLLERQANVLHEKADLIQKGEQMIADGRAMVARGTALKDQGNVLDGQNLVIQGEAKIRQGNNCLAHADAIALPSTRPARPLVDAERFDADSAAVQTDPRDIDR